MKIPPASFLHHRPVRMLMSLLVAAVCSVNATAGAADLWQDAQWIWQEAAGPANTWVAFRKTVDLDVVPTEAVANIATDTKYWLWVNGEMVLFEGGLARGPAPGDGYYDVVDLEPYLQAGENTIALLVWYWGKTAKTHESSGQGGLLFSAHLGSRTLTSNQSWKMKVHPSYDPRSEGLDRSANRANAMDVKYDARVALGDWSEDAWYLSGYNDESWATATEKGPAYSAPWGDLVERPIPQWIDHGLKDYESLKVGNQTITLPYTNTGSQTVTISGKLPWNQQITPFFKINSTSGKVVEVGMENVRNLIDAQYTTKGGTQSFEAYSWMNGHYAEYEIPPGVEVLELKYRWTAYDEITGVFESSDPFFDRLWTMAANTLQVCARDSFMDCPDRERGLWIGDVADQTGPVFYTLNEPGRLLLKKGIENTFAYQPGDIIQGLAPGFGEYRGSSSELCAQSLQYIEQGIWRYYFNTGDRATLAYAYPYVVRYLKLWQMLANGLPEERRGYAGWVDWGLNADSTPTHIAWYYIALQSAVKMANELGIPDDLDWYEERIASIEQNYSRVYWQDGYFGRPGRTREERSSSLAILGGLATEAEQQAIFETVLQTDYNASPHMEWIVLEAMMLTGNHAAGLERMKNRHMSQVANADLTTLSERYENDPGRGGSTYNHAWNAPNYVLSRYIAGVSATEVAWARYQVLPNLAHLTSLRKVVPSVKGDITVDIQLADNALSMNLVSPLNTLATVGIPKASILPKTIKVNDQVVWNHETGQRNFPGVTFQGQDNDYVYFEVAPGTWSFNVDSFTIVDDTWIRFPDYDFGEKAAMVEIVAASDSAGGTVELRLDAVDGPLLSTVLVSDTGGFQIYDTFTAALDRRVVGVEDVYLVFKGGSGRLMNVRSIGFVPQPLLVLEAEEAQFENTFVNTSTVASNGEFLKAASNMKVGWSFSSRSGLSALSFRVKSVFAARSMGVFLNAEQVGTISSLSGAWEVQTLVVDLPSGNNLVELRATDSTSLTLDVDLLSIDRYKMPPLQISHQGTDAGFRFDWVGRGVKLQINDNGLQGPDWADFPQGDVSPVAFAVSSDISALFFRLVPNSD